MTAPIHHDEILAAWRAALANGDAGMLATLNAIYPATSVYETPAATNTQKSPTERVWQEGDYVLAADGHVVRYQGTSGWRNTTGHYIADDAVCRPLTLLVRDGKRVQR